MLETFLKNLELFDQMIEIISNQIQKSLELLRSRVDESIIKKYATNFNKTTVYFELGNSDSMTLGKFLIDLFAFYGAFKIKDVQIQNVHNLEIYQNELDRLKEKEYKFYGLQLPKDEFHELPRPAGNRKPGLSSKNARKPGLSSIFRR